MQRYKRIVSSHVFQDKHPLLRFPTYPEGIGALDLPITARILTRTKVHRLTTTSFSRYMLFAETHQKVCRISDHGRFSSCFGFIPILYTSVQQINQDHSQQALGASTSVFISLACFSLMYEIFRKETHFNVFETTQEAPTKTKRSCG